jgi:ABC transporter substrate binding protein
MKRRQFISLLGGAAAAWPLAARAQQPGKIPRIGLVSAQSRSAPNNAAFEKRLAELGYQDGKDFIFDFVQVASLEAWETAFQGLGARKVDIMVAAGPEIAVKTALATSDTIPIVMIAIDYDPFARGYVTSLARPSGNITGIFLRQIELTVKRLQLVKDAFPDMQAATVFWDRISADQWEAARDASGKLGLRVVGIELREQPYDYDHALAQAARTIARTSSCWCHHSFFSGSRTPRRPGAAQSCHIDVRLPRMGRGGWSAVLRAEHRRDVPTCGRVGGPDCEGSEANRPADRAADQVRTCGQPQDRQRNRYRDFDFNPAARRSGDRIKMPFCCGA